jgi:hypothetical protein
MDSDRAESELCLMRSVSEEDAPLMAPLVAAAAAPFAAAAAAAAVAAPGGSAAFAKGDDGAGGVSIAVATAALWRGAPGARVGAGGEERSM